MQSVNRFAKLLALAALCAGAAWANNPGMIQGVVKGSDGKPVSGAYVRVIDSDGLTMMVVSRAQGKFSASNLKPGKYTVQAVGGDMQSDTTSVDVSGSKPGAASLALSDQRAADLAPGWRGTPGVVGGGEVWTKTPRPPLPDGPGKEIAQQKCGQCHTYSWFLSFRASSRDDWAALIDSMRSNIAGSDGKADDLTPEEVNTLADYFWANLKKPVVDVNSRLPHTLATGIADKYFVVDYKVPHMEAETHEMTVGTDGDGYAGERNTGRIAKLDPTTNTFSEVIPPAGMSPRIRLGAISHGNGDTLWTLDAGPNHRWLEYNVMTGAFRSFDVPKDLKGRGNGNTIRQAPNGDVWVATGGADGMTSFNPTTGKWTIFESPAGKKMGKSVGPYGFTFDNKGDVWFAEYANNAVGHVDPKTGEVDDYPVPIPNAVPRKVNTDAQGNIWVALHESGQLLMVDPNHPDQMKTFMPPSGNPGTYSPSIDLKNGYVWVALQAVDKIDRFDPKTNTWAEFPVPYPETDIRRIEVDQKHPNRIWWTGTLSGHFGYIETLDR
jgi:streptogramin lyase